jgi:multicomponent Na+:H+ antiporter subunit D
MLSMFFLAPLILAIILNILPKRWMRVPTFWLLLALCALQAAVVLFPVKAFWAADPISGFFGFSLFCDSLALTALLSGAIVFFFAAILGVSVKENENQRFNFVSLLLIMLAGMNGLVLTSDIFTLYVFIEVVSISSFILIAFHKDRDALEGAFKYFIFSAIASVVMLSAIGLLVIVAGGTSFAEIKAAMPLNAGNPILVFSTALYLVALLIKGGLMPFHGWLPDAYQAAPPSVSILLAGIITKATGIYPLIRVFHSVFGISAGIGDAMMFIGAGSLVLAAFAALTQTNFKRMLAYSSISQLGYIVLSLGCGTPLGLAAAIFHFFNHSIFKSILFVNAASIQKRIGSMDMGRMGGLAQVMPVTGITSALASLSVAGVPPLSGFWSKLLIIVALYASGNMTYAVIALLTSVVTLGYMLSLQRHVFFGKLPNEHVNKGEAGSGFVIASIALTVILIVISLAFPLLYGTFLIPAGGL